MKPVPKPCLSQRGTCANASGCNECATRWRTTDAWCRFFLDSCWIGVVRPSSWVLSRFYQTGNMKNHHILGYPISDEPKFAEKPFFLFLCSAEKCNPHLPYEVDNRLAKCDSEAGFYQESTRYATEMQNYIELKSDWAKNHVCTLHRDVLYISD